MAALQSTHGPVDLFRDLLDAGSFPHATDDYEAFESHTGHVFLVGPCAYKIRKPVVLEGLVDYSTASRRKLFLSKEILLNRDLGHDLYQEVVAVYLDGSGRPTLTPYGQPVDYLLKMVRMPSPSLLPAQFAKERFLDAEEIGQLADEVSRFHGRCPATTQGWEQRLQKVTRIAARGAQEHFPARGVAATVRRLQEFLERQGDRFGVRAQGGFVRDVHGDLKLENIFFHDRTFYLFDRVEFDEDLRVQDVALDIAAMLVDLRAWGQTSLADQLVAKYERVAGDPGLGAVLPFYACLRALLSAYVIEAGQLVHRSWSRAPEAYLKIASDVSSAW